MHNSADVEKEQVPVRNIGTLTIGHDAIEIEVAPGCHRDNLMKFMRQVNLFTNKRVSAEFRGKKMAIVSPDSPM